MKYTDKRRNEILAYAEKTTNYQAGKKFKMNPVTISYWQKKFNKPTTTATKTTNSAAASVLGLTDILSKETLEMATMIGILALAKESLSRNV